MTDQPTPDPIAYGPTGYSCGCGKNAHSNLVPCQPTDQSAERQERYAVAIHDAMESDLSLDDQEPAYQALFARAAEAAVALADAEQFTDPAADRYRTAWHSARRRASVLSAEITRRAPLLGEYAAEIKRLRKELATSERNRENADFHLGQEMARRQRAEKEAAQPRADRDAVLREAAQRLYTALFPAVYNDLGQKAAEGVNRAVSELRRLADETQDTEHRPPTHRWAAEFRDPAADEWIPGTRFLNQHHAAQRYEAAIARAPMWSDGTPVQRRLVRETTTYTVEAEHPAAADLIDPEPTR